MVGDLRQASALLRSSQSNKSCLVQQFKSPGHSPEVDEKDNNNLVDVSIRLGDNSVNQAGGCVSLVADVVKDQEFAGSLPKTTDIAMPRGLFTESSKQEDRVETNIGGSVSENNSELDPSKDDSLSDAAIVSPPCNSEIDQPDGSVLKVDLIQPSRAASDVTVLPSMENTHKNTDSTESDQELRSRFLSSRQTFALPRSSSQDKSKLLTLDENQELQVPSSVRAGNVPLPPMSGRISQAMMGRRHSMDSNIGRSRPPTFVRTYRDVKWKRVSKPSKLRQMTRTSSTGNLAAAAAADSGADDKSESREYISGTHIIRQRVPIFMTSGDPPDPMGRRFSAGDLIPLTGPGQHWAPNGKCLVIRDMVPSKLAENSSSDDSSSSSSTPASSSEDVRSTHSSGSRHSNIDREDNCEFSLIDEDDEDNDDSSEDGSEEDEEGENVNNSSSKLSDTEFTPGASMTPSTSSSSSENLAGLSKKSDAQKPFDLRRLALENSLQQKAIALHQSAVSNPETLPLTTPESLAQGSYPALLESTTVVNQPSTTTVGVQPAVVATGANISTTANLQPTLTSSAGEPTSTVASRHLPVIPISSQLTTLSAYHSNLGSDAGAGILMPALSLSPAAVPQFLMTPATSQHILSVTGQPTSIPAIPLPSTISLTVSLPDGKPTALTIINEKNLDSASNNNELHPEFSLEADPQQHSASPPFVSRPPSPYEMPWVMTSTKIADANVYVSSSSSPNSHMSTRSAHWISPRNVEGTIPIHLDDSKAIRVETVSVPTTSGDETFQFQKVSYSSGFIISSAQWVAPTEVKETSSANALKVVPSAKTSALQPHLPDPTSVMHQNVPDIPGIKPSLASKKARRKYVPQNTGVNQQPVLSVSELHTGLKPASQIRRPKQKISVINVKNGHLSDQETVSPAQKVSAVPRKLKRNFIAEKGIIDPLLLLESDLCAQLHHSSPVRCLSPAITKRRFVVEKVPEDSLSKDVAAVLSPVFNVVPTPLHPTWGFVLKDLKESTFRNKAEKTGSSSPLSASSEKRGKDLQVVSPETDTVKLPSTATRSESAENNTQSTSTVSDTESIAESRQRANAVSESGTDTNSTQLQNLQIRSEPIAESTQLTHTIRVIKQATGSTLETSALSESGLAAESTRKSSAISGTESAAGNSRLEAPGNVNFVRELDSVAHTIPTSGGGHGIVTDDTQSPTRRNQQSPVVDATPTLNEELETVFLTTSGTMASWVEKENLAQMEHPIPDTTLEHERQAHLSSATPANLCKKLVGSADTSLPSPTHQHDQDKLQEIPLATENSTIEHAKAAADSETPTRSSKSSESSTLPESPSSQTRATRLRTDTDDDERFAKENEALLQIILSSLSEDKELVSLDNNNWVQHLQLDQNHNFGKDAMVISNRSDNNPGNTADISNTNSSNNNNNNTVMGSIQQSPNLDPAHRPSPDGSDNNGFGPDIMTFEGMPTLPMSMSAEDMANMPIPMGVQEFLMPMEAFFFSGFQCFEPLAGGSTVAIDNKIEQAMDLVKRHLMYAVREEVEILKQQIGEMMERIGQLEYENSILRSEAKPETLSKLQQPRLTQPPQAVLPSQPQTQTASLLLAPVPQHPAVPQVQPPQQQPTAVSQVGQPPSTT